MNRSDVVVIGVGAAGLSTAIFLARRRPELQICALDGAKKVGAKILVSGGGRCNVTNQIVTADHYFGGNRNIIRKVLSALPVDRTLAFFDEIGVALHAEDRGKLFPNSNSARTVLAALLAEAERLRIRILPSHRVDGVTRREAEFNVHFRREDGEGVIAARAVVLATGGRSLPKTGSDGGGYALASALGHSLIPQTPALAPLVLEADYASPSGGGINFESLSGIAQPAGLTLHRDGEKSVRLDGPMLWTHFGISGPAAMDISRVWLRAALERASPRLELSMLPDESFETVEARLLEQSRSQPRLRVASLLESWLPGRIAAAILELLRIDGEVALAHLSREARRSIAHGLLALPLHVRDSRGYGYAEATAGGVPLEEVDASSMQSRIAPGLFLTGEILDVDGRIGGYNFQWAWSSAFVAARGIDARLTKP